MRWLVRMSRWVRHPPSPQMFWMVLGIVVFALLVAGLEYMGWWPDWATAQKLRRKPF